MLCQDAWGDGGRSAPRRARGNGCGQFRTLVRREVRSGVEPVIAPLVRMLDGQMPVGDRDQLVLALGAKVVPAPATHPSRHAALDRGGRIMPRAGVRSGRRRRARACHVRSGSTAASSTGRSPRRLRRHRGSAQRRSELRAVSPRSRTSSPADGRRPAVGRTVEGRRSSTACGEPESWRSWSPCSAG